MIFSPRKKKVMILAAAWTAVSIVIVYTVYNYGWEEIRTIPYIGAAIKIFGYASVPFVLTMMMLDTYQIWDEKPLFRKRQLGELTPRKSLSEKWDEIKNSEAKRVFLLFAGLWAVIGILVGITMFYYVENDVRNGIDLIVVLALTYAFVWCRILYNIFRREGNSIN